MTNPIDRRKRTSAEAATWWVRLQAEQLSLADRQEFVDWLRESALHVAEMLRMAQVHGALEQFRKWAEVETDCPDSGEENVIPLAPADASTEGGDDVPTTAGKKPREIRSKLERWRRSAPLAIALALGILAISAELLWRTYSGQSIRTERGERREVVLSDGSIVEVDQETRLRVKLSQQTRHVFLDVGRALFRVSKNPRRPFIVQTGGVTIRAVGTAFAVERQLQDVVVTVAEGRVGVLATVPDSRVGGGNAEGDASEEKADHTTTGAASGSAAPPSPRANEGEVFLTANQQIAVSTSGSAETVREVDSRRALAWAEGRLVFDNDSVAQVVEQFNRYNRVQLRVADETLASRPVSGIFNATDPESFIAFLQGVTSVRVIRGSGGSIILAPEAQSSAGSNDRATHAPR